MTASERIRTARSDRQLAGITRMKELSAGQCTESLEASLAVVEAALAIENLEHLRLSRAIILDELESR